ncbi:MAG: UDP-glucose 4-epimerase GalE [Synergistaceae bacterium]|jgi:UDP-glucose 4-epimerase|nr:UDP-glucose 4-epimerase GalE [Synergistaceae bacterium]
MSILVTGGAGFIGSHACVELIGAGYGVIVADSLINSSEEAVRRVERITGAKVRFYRLDVTRYEGVDALFAENPDIKSVIHFAGLKAVGESVAKPLEYYFNNISCTLTLLRAMRKYGVKNFVFSSSATVYGDPASVPVVENFPMSATNPYGATKLFIERILRDVCAAEPSWNAAILRYFNPAGAHKSGLIGEDPNGIPNNLVPYIAQVAVGRLERVRIFGNDYPTHDGTGVRDYIHVVDLAKGHVAALKKLETNCGEFICNLGTGRGYSVMDVVAAFERACGKKIDHEITLRRPGDIATVYADPSKALRELGWKAEYGIDEMCADSWRWQSANPNGYGK